MKLNGKTVRAKVRATRNPLFGDEKYVGGEPVWDTERAEKMSDADFDHFLRKSFYYYNYFYTQKDTKKYVVEWLKQQENYLKQDIRAFERSSDRAISMTVHSLIMAHRQGMPLLERHLKFIGEQIERAVKGADAEVVEVPAAEAPRATVPTIQDRLNEKTADTIGELEGHYDEFLKNPRYQFKPYDFLVANNVPQSQLTKYELLFQARFDELKTAFTKTDEQLSEGYSHYKIGDYKRIMSFIDQILNDIIQYRGVKRATKKVRAPKSIPKEKTVAKLKYAREDKVLRLVSVPATDIVGAQTLWCYDTKTRKIIVYYADSLTGPLTVKGTSIAGFDVARSVTKTLRKPEEQLKEFARASKVELRKFVDGIKTTEAKANGRINPNQILLKTI
jgi:hypothetical protein